MNYLFYIKKRERERVAHFYSVGQHYMIFLYNREGSFEDDFSGYDEPTDDWNKMNACKISLVDTSPPSKVCICSLL